MTAGDPGRGAPTSTVWATQMASLMALLQARADPLLLAKQARMWLGPGLGSVAKKVYEKIVKWEFVDMAELRQKSPGEKLPADSDTQRLVVLPGFELAQAKQKPINNIFMWATCYARYVAALAKEHPSSTPGLMAHLMTVLKTYMEVEEPG